MWILQVMGSGVDTAGSGKRLDATGYGRSVDAVLVKKV